MNSLPKTFRKPQVEPVKRGIRKNDTPDGTVAFESDGLHDVKLPELAALFLGLCRVLWAVITGSNKREGCSAS
jgi:hypothetical protein